MHSTAKLSLPLALFRRAALWDNNIRRFNARDFHFWNYWVGLHLGSFRKGNQRRPRKGNPLLFKLCHRFTIVSLQPKKANDAHRIQRFEID